MKIVGILEKVNMHRFKKYIFFCFLYIKWLKSLKKHGNKQNGVEVIASGDKSWLNEKNIKTQLGHANLTDFTLQYPPNLRKQRQELQKCGKN